MKPTVALTMGDAAGIGPEICLRAAADPRVLAECTPVIVGSADVLAAVAEKLGLRLPPQEFRPASVRKGFSPGGPGIVNLANLRRDAVVPGRVTDRCGRAAYECIVYAINQTLAGSFAAMTTAPISKEALHEAGVQFAGHTEILDHLTREVHGREPGRAVMMLYSPRVTVSLVTTHVALKDVPGALEAGDIGYVIRRTHEAMTRILSRAPRIAVLGLNCHAGEGGLFGDEERRAIGPAIERARADGMDVTGPLPPDTAFTPRALERYDAHVCMYHDQGLIAFKTLSFEEGVNVTLGIPIIRTSVDHGTAFDIAWQGKADHASLVSALLLAARLTRA